MTATAPWPIGGLPEGSDYRTWLRAASLGGTTVRELLQDTLPVQAAAYQRALEDLAVDALAVAHPSIGLTVDRDVLLEMTAEEVAAAMPAAVATGPRRWELHVTAESTITTALRHLQDNEVSECMALLVRAVSQVFDVVLLDRNEQKVEG